MITWAALVAQHALDWRTLNGPKKRINSYTLTIKDMVLSIVLKL